LCKQWAPPHPSPLIQDSTQPITPCSGPPRLESAGAPACTPTHLPDARRGRAQQLALHADALNLRLGREERRVEQQLAEDAAHTPHVDGLIVHLECVFLFVCVCEGECVSVCVRECESVCVCECASV